VQELVAEVRLEREEQPKEFQELQFDVPLSALLQLTVLQVQHLVSTHQITLLPFSLFVTVPLFSRGGLVGVVLVVLSHVCCIQKTNYS
jgi:hypothetical protein